MTSTVVAVNSALDVKKFSVALFARLARKQGFRGKLTGPAPQDGEAARGLRQESNAGYPIVEIRDLTKGSGDQVSYDIVDIATGKPVMGDRRLSGRGMALNFGSQTVRIDQYRGMVDPGGRMTQQRTLHDLRMLALANLEGWNNTLLDNLTHVHLAGSRGYQTGRDWNVPLASDPDFTSICINPINPPTYNRRWISGHGLGSISVLDNTDTLNLYVLDELRTQIDESDYPLQGVRLENDPQQDDDEPLYVMYVSPRGYDQLRNTTSPMDWNTLVSTAVTRGSVTGHPLFGNGAIMWRGILIRKTRRVIRFATGNTVQEYASDGVTVNTTAAPVGFDRAILMGAQALGVAYGQNTKSRFYINWHEEETDHGNRIEVSTSIMGGYSKLTFNLNNTLTDHGVWAVDHYNGL